MPFIKDEQNSQIIFNLKKFFPKYFYWSAEDEAQIMNHFCGAYLYVN